MAGAPEGTIQHRANGDWIKRGDKFVRVPGTSRRPEKLSVGIDLGKPGGDHTAAAVAVVHKPSRNEKMENEFKDAIAGIKRPKPKKAKDEAFTNLVASIPVAAYVPPPRPTPSQFANSPWIPTRESAAKKIEMLRAYFDMEEPEDRFIDKLDLILAASSAESAASLAKRVEDSYLIHCLARSKKLSPADAVKRRQRLIGMLESKGDIANAEKQKAKLVELEADAASPAGEPPWRRPEWRG